jgi:hypothetical protein
LGRFPKVMAITKRTAELCATQALLYAAGFELVTATNLVSAHALVKAMNVRGVVVCLHSWTDAERDAIFAEIKELNLPIMKCQGCTGCDEACGKAGTLNSLIPLSSLIEQLGMPS